MSYLTRSEETPKGWRRIKRGKLREDGDRWWCVKRRRWILTALPGHINLGSYKIIRRINPQRIRKKDDLVSTLDGHKYRPVRGGAIRRFSYDSEVVPTAPKRRKTRLGGRAP